LVKHTEAKEYLNRKNDTAIKLAAKYLNLELLSDSNTKFTNNGVDFISSCGNNNHVQYLTPEDELIVSIFYSVTNLTFRQLWQQVSKLSSANKADIINTFQQERGQYDNPSREFEVGQMFIFDTLMDYGAYRDLQRHRICTQLNQKLTTKHGYSIPRDLEDAGLLPIYAEAMEASANAVATLSKDFIDEAGYLIALGYKKRTLFKMNLREFYHIVELRTKSGGHFSYRELVYEMYEQFKQQHPLLVSNIRAVKMDFDGDFYNR